MLRLGADTVAAEVLRLGAAAAAAEVAGTAELGLLVFEQMEDSTCPVEEHEKFGSGRIGVEAAVGAIVYSVGLEEEH